MSIQEIIAKINSFIEDDTTFYSLLILFVGVASFGLGTQVSGDIATPNQAPKAQHAQEILIETEESSETAVQAVVASKNSDKYHLPWCSGAERISETNKIYFDSETDAKAAGYSPAANCKGLQP